MPNDALQQLLSQISAQTGQPTPNAKEVQSFLDSPGSQALLQAIAGTDRKSTRLNSSHTS